MAGQQLPPNPNGWRLRYLTWLLGSPGSPQFAPGSVVLHTQVAVDDPLVFLMVWIEPVD